MREHGTKTTPVFLPADGEASWSLLPSSVSLLSGGTVRPENTYSSILKATVLIVLNSLKIEPGKFTTEFCGKRDSERVTKMDLTKLWRKQLRAQRKVFIDTVELKEGLVYGAGEF